MRKKDDYKDFSEKKCEFACKHWKIIILLSFIYSLAMFLVSVFFPQNRAARAIIVVYPFCLFFFIINLIDTKFFHNFKDTDKFIVELFLMLVHLLATIVDFIDGP